MHLARLSRTLPLVLIVFAAACANSGVQVGNDTPDAGDGDGGVSDVAVKDVATDAPPPGDGSTCKPGVCPAGFFDLDGVTTGPNWMESGILTAMMAWLNW